MKVFTVHTRRGSLDIDRDVVIVKEGFSWPAFIFSVIWAIWCRLWLVAIGLLVVEVIASAMMAWLNTSMTTQAIVAVGLALGLGVFGNDLWRWTLARRGFVMSDVVAAADRDAAEQRYFERHPQLAEEYAR